jgi:hypothetical protein
MSSRAHDSQAQSAEAARTESNRRPAGTRPREGFGGDRIIESRACTCRAAFSPFGCSPRAASSRPDGQRRVLRHAVRRCIDRDRGLRGHPRGAHAEAAARRPAGEGDRRHRLRRDCRFRARQRCRHPTRRCGTFDRGDTVHWRPAGDERRCQDQTRHMNRPHVEVQGLR